MTTKPETTFAVGDRVYSDKHNENGEVEEIKTANDCTKQNVYYVKLDNGETRHFIGKELEKGDDVEEEVEEIE